MKTLISSIPKFLLPLFVFLASFAIYAFTLAPAITAGDTTEMITAALTLGIPHQQSYPFISIVGHIFSRLPIGDNPLWRINLMSAFFEALTCLLIYFIILKLYLAFSPSTPSVPLRTSPLRVNSERLALSIGNRAFLCLFAASAALFLAFSLTFWQYGTKAEVFALNNFFSALVILTILVFLEKKERRFFYLAVFLGSLAFSHHQIAILVGPPLLFLILKEEKEILLKREVWIKSLFFAILGFLPYYYALTWLAKGDPLLNWGNPVDLPGVLRALARTDFGSFAYLRTPYEKVLQTPVDQAVFYLNSLIYDFTILGPLLASLGGFYLWRKERKIFFFLLIGLLTGIGFLAYARFSLTDSFNLATAKRFQLLPNLFFVGFLAFGILFIWQRFLALGLNFKEKINFFTGTMIFLALCLAFTLPLLINFPKANNRNNLITLKYGLDFYLPTEPNALIMLSGDVPNFAAYFIKVLQQAQGEPDQRVVFTPGQFHLYWFIPQLKSRYPDLIIPPPEPGKRFTTTSQVIRANLDKRPIYISPELVFYDPEMEKEFVLWPKNLLFKVGKKGEEEKLEPYREESQWLWESIDLSWFSKIRKNKPLMEEIIIGYYARHFHNLGYMYESVKLYDDAIREYKRAIDIDPYLSESLKNLGLIYGMKLEPRDYPKAVDYLGKFVSLVEKDSPELADSGRYTIAKIMEEQEKERKKWEEEMATRSGEVRE